jgi:hypothetical protein
MGLHVEVGMRNLNRNIEHVRVASGVVLYDTASERWFLAEGAAADAVDGGSVDPLGLDTLRAAGLAPGRPRTKGLGRVQELALGTALALLAAGITLGSGAALAATTSSYTPPSDL